jgi:hypothetical protein
LLANEASGKTLDVQGILNIVEGTDSAKEQIAEAKIAGGGTLNIHTEVSAKSIISEEGSVIQIGNKDNTGKFYADTLQLKGTMFLDPTWENGQESSEAAFNLDGKLEG